MGDVKNQGNSAGGNIKNVDNTKNNNYGDHYSNAVDHGTVVNGHGNEISGQGTVNYGRRSLMGDVKNQGNSAGGNIKNVDNTKNNNYGDHYTNTVDHGTVVNGHGNEIS